MSSSSNILGIVTANMVPERHFFLEFLNNRMSISVLRILFFILTLSALMIYKYMKGKSGK